MSRACLPLSNPSDKHHHDFSFLSITWSLGVILSSAALSSSLGLKYVSSTLSEK